MGDLFPHPKRSEYQARHPDINLKSGDGGGTYDGMEERVTRLEIQVEHILQDTAALKSDMTNVKDRLSDITAQLARIDAKLDSKIDYKWLTVYVLGIVAVIMRNEIASFLTGSGG